MEGETNNYLFVCRKQTSSCCCSGAAAAAAPLRPPRRSELESHDYDPPEITPAELGESLMLAARITKRLVVVNLP